MLIGIPVESHAGETRVAATPKTVASFIALGFDVAVEAGAGVRAGFADADYAAAGAKVVAGETGPDEGEVWKADVVLKVRAPTLGDGDSGDGGECARLASGATVIGFVQPAQQPALMEACRRRGVNLMAMDAVPRISRAQSLDALSAMSNIAGYRAVVEAAHAFGRFLGGQMTAAGNVPPAKVLVIGAGVAGLSAIGVAGNLGAVVRAFDARAETREQVQSLDAEFLSADVADVAVAPGQSDGYTHETTQAFDEAARRLYAEQVKQVDIIITTAQIPGKRAPLLLDAEIISTMKRGSVIVDLAAAGGGNCEGTVAGEKITTENGVHIIGYTDMEARLPTQASRLYGETLVNLLKLLCPQKDGVINIDFDEPVLRAMTVVRNGEVTWPPPPMAVAAPSPPPAAAGEGGSAAAAGAEPAPPRRLPRLLFAAAAAALYATVSVAAPPAFVSHFTVFMLACVAGYYVVWNVTHALHTPLMSVTNAISGIIILGALLQIGGDDRTVNILAFIAVLIASINIFGGFAVTRRMLDMFRRK